MCLLVGLNLIVDRQDIGVVWKPTVTILRSDLRPPDVDVLVRASPLEPLTIPVQQDREVGVEGVVRVGRVPDGEEVSGPVHVSVCSTHREAPLAGDVGGPVAKLASGWLQHSRHDAVHVCV